MAKQTAGILGPVRGKVSNVVGAHWKETDYFRAYVVPANPDTALQQAQRAKMALCVWTGRLLLGGLLQPLWDPFQKKQSGFNRYCQVNIKRVDATLDLEDLLVSEGQLEPTTAIDSASYNDGTGLVALEWGGSVLGNGLATDKVIIAVIDEENQVAWVDTSTYVRSDTSGNIDIGGDRTATDLTAYVGMHRGTGTLLMVAPSLSSAVSAA